MRMGFPDLWLHVSRRQALRRQKEEMTKGDQGSRELLSS